MIGGRLTEIGERPLTSPSHSPWASALSAIQSRSRFELILWVLLIAGAIHSCIFLAVTLNNPLLDEHAFRQTQTAVNVYYILKEGSVIDYQTPTFGTPWANPFEAPVYQLFVAGVVEATGFGIDPAGRLVSYIFLLGTIALGSLTLRRLFPEDRYVALLFAGLMFFSPLYLFWGRTVLIETCATFFAMAWLYLSIRATQTRNIWLAAVAIPIGIIASLAKATTLPAFLLAYGLFWLSGVYRERRFDLAMTLTIGVGAALAFAVGLAWTEHSHAVRAQGTLGRSLEISEWIYGTWQDRIGPRMWRDILPDRMLPNILGLAWIVILVAGTHLGTGTRYFWAALASVVLFAVPVAIFANLHLYHDYYQVANGLFLIAFAAIVVAGLLARNRTRAAIIVLAILVLGQVVRIATTQWPSAARDMTKAAPLLAGRFIKESTPENSALVLIGPEGTPEFHYYAERKGLVVPSWVSKSELEQSFKNPVASVGGMPIGAVVRCPFGHVEGRPDLKPAWEPFFLKAKARALTRGKTASFGGCSVYILPADEK